MVDTHRRGRFSAANRSSIENLHRIESLGFFANFRRIKLNANTCDLSTAVSQWTNCGDQPQRQRKRDDRGREMFFLLRIDILARAGARAAAQGEDAEFGQAAADRRVGSGVGRDRGGVRHEPVLQAPAGRLRSRRPGRDRDRPARPGRRPQALQHHHRQEGDTGHDNRLDRRRRRRRSGRAPIARLDGSAARYADAGSIMARGVARRLRRMARADRN